MLSTAPSLRQILGFECPVCGHILTQSEREDEFLYCPECGYSLLMVSQSPINTDTPL